MKADNIPKTTKVPRRDRPRAKQTAIAIALGFICAVALFAFTRDEVRVSLLTTLAPSRARISYTYRFTSPEGRILYLLGTMHDRHYESQGYSLWHIAAMIKHLHPDILLVESRPEDLQEDNPANGPQEMLFANLYAHSLGIPVAGFDWWPTGSAASGKTEQVRKETMEENIITANSQYRTSLVLAEISYVLYLKDHLPGRGLKMDPLPLEDKQALFALEDIRQVFPPGTTHYLTKEINRARSYLRASNLPPDSLQIRTVRAHLTQLQNSLDKVEATGEVAFSDRP